MGKELFTKYLSPLAELSNDWRHVGLVCLPNVQSKEDLRNVLNDKYIEVCVKYRYCEAQGKGRARGGPRKVTQR